MTHKVITAAILATTTTTLLAGDDQDDKAVSFLASMRHEASQLCMLRAASDFKACVDEQAKGMEEAGPLMQKLDAAGDAYSIGPECMRYGGGQYQDWAATKECLDRRIAQTHALDYYNSTHPEKPAAPKPKPRKSAPQSPKAMPVQGKRVDM